MYTVTVDNKRKEKKKSKVVFDEIQKCYFYNTRNDIVVFEITTKILSDLRPSNTHLLHGIN